MNRKSRSYDKPYYKLYENLKKVFLDGENIYESLLNSAKNINQKPGTLWRSLLFKTTNIGVVRKNGKFSIHLSGHAVIYQSSQTFVLSKISGSSQSPLYRVMQ